MTRRGLVLMFLAASIAFSQRRTLPPPPAINEEGWQEFVSKLRDALRRGDAAYLTSIVSPNIKNGFGGDDGIAAFRKTWKLDRPHSPVFPLLSKLLDLGVVSDGEHNVWAPYLFETFPDDLDPFEHSVVTGKNVYLRSGPGMTAKPLRVLSYEIVKLDKMQKDWHKVSTLDGVTGYVSERYLHSPAGYRACFAKESGQWRMVYLVAGD
jgi:hypothetical protein